MAFRAEKRAGAFLTAFLMAPALFAEQSFQFQVWHGHSRPPHIRKAGNAGTLTIDAVGVSFQETGKDKKKPPKHPVSWRWKYADIEQLKVEPDSITVLTYKDVWWKMGADREYEFDLPSGKAFEQAYGFLKSHLDQRFVAAMATAAPETLWEIPVKRLVRFGGDQGVLQVGAGEIVFRAEKEDDSRTWRYQDIDNISSSGPFQLTITTFERAKLDYGSLKQFNFQLKQRLDEGRYNDLWLRLNRSKGLGVLQAVIAP